MLNIIFFASFGALGLTGLACWRIAWLRHCQGLSVVDPDGTRNLVGSPFGFVDVLLVFFFWFGGQAFSLGMAIWLLGVPHDELSILSGDRKAMLLGMVASGQLLATVMAFGLLWIRYRKNLTAISLHPKFFGRDIVLGLVAFSMVIPIILIVQWVLTWLVPYEHASLELLNDEAGFLTFAVVWFSAGFVAPVCEELFFRGVVQSWLQRIGSGRWKSDQIMVGGWDSVATGGLLGPSSLGPDTANSANSANTAKPVKKSIEDSNPYRSPYSGENSDVNERSWMTNSHWPIFVTAMFFSLLHFGQGAAPIPLFIFAVALGYLFRKSGSILPCIILHMLLNVFSLFWFTLNIFFGDPETIPQEVVAEWANLCELSGFLGCWF